MRPFTTQAIKIDEMNLSERTENVFTASIYRIYTVVAGISIQCGARPSQP
jgi:hypothetical protein